MTYSKEEIGYIAKELYTNKGVEWRQTDAYHGLSKPVAKLDSLPVSFWSLTEEDQDETLHQIDKELLALFEEEIAQN